MINRQYINIFKSLELNELIFSELSKLFFDTKLSAGNIVTLLYSVNHSTPELTAAKIIAETLKINQTIVELILPCGKPHPGGWSRTYIGDAGVKLIAEMLKVNNTLQIFNCFASDIGDIGATAIAQALKYNKSVKSLNVSFNENIRASGFKQLVDMMEVNRTLQYVDLSNTRPGNAGMIYLAQALSKNPEMPKLHLTQMGNTPEGVKKLKESFDGKSIRYFIKHVSIFEDSGYSLHHIGPSLIDKVDFWNRKMEYLNGKYFNGLFSPLEKIPSLKDITTDYILASKDPKLTSELEKLPIDLQDYLGLYGKELKFALYACTSMLTNHLKDDFLVYLANSDNAFDYAALSTYYLAMNNTEMTKKYLLLAHQLNEDSLQRFLSEAKNLGMIDNKIDNFLLELRSTYQNNLCRY